MSVIIDTEVFGHVRGLLRNVAKSVTDISESVDEYLSTAEEELKLRLDEIYDLELRAKDKMEEAEKEMLRAEIDLENAKAETQRAHEEMESAITESKNLWDQYNDMRNQYKDMIEEAKEGGYFDEDAQGVKEEAQAIKEEALEQNKVVQEKKAAYYAAKNREENARRNYNAKVRYYNQCVSIYNARVKNRKKAETLFEDFNKYKDFYYHAPAVPITWGVDLYLKFIANNITGVALEAVDQIEESVKNIVCISMDPNNPVAEYYPSESYHEKDEFTEIRIRENLEKTDRRQKEELEMDSDAKPDPFVRCSTCGYPKDSCQCYQKRPHAE